MMDVCSVESGCAYSDEQIAGANLWGVDLANLENLWPAWAGDDHGAHAGVG